MNDDNYELFTMKEWVDALRIGLIVLGITITSFIVVIAVGWVGEIITDMVEHYASRL